jgi:hypothetical protein
VRFCNGGFSVLRYLHIPYPARLCCGFALVRVALERLPIGRIPTWQAVGFFITSITIFLFMLFCVINGIGKST